MSGETFEDCFDENLYDRFSKLKEIYIELPDYREMYFKNNSCQEDQSDQPDKNSQADRREIPFFGREELQERLSTLIKERKSGSYLITGFRGVGKTMLVDKVLEQLNTDIKNDKGKSDKNDEGKSGKNDKTENQNSKNKTKNVESAVDINEIIEIRLSVAQENLTYRDLLRGIVKKLHHKFDERTKFDRGKNHSKFSFWWSPLAALYIVLAFLLLPSLLPTYTHIWGFNLQPILESFRVEPISENFEFYLMLSIVAIASIFFLAYTEQPKIIERWKLKFSNDKNLKDLIFFRKLEELIHRMDGRLAYNNSESSFFGYSHIGQRKSKDQSVQYQQATDKELEYELLALLEAWNGDFCKNIVFVFDELDKVEARSNMGLTDKEEGEPEIYNESEGSIYGTPGMRRRQEAIARILANMKHFMNNAPASFIVIAGSEMFDASMADISSRDSFYNSIFDEIFYVPSLLKSDVEPKGYGGVTSMIENYLVHLLFSKTDCLRDKIDPTSCVKIDRTKVYRLKHFFELLDKAPNSSVWMVERKKRKVLITLQNFIIFLAYRSNGISRKMKQLIDDQVVLKNFDENEHYNNNALIVKRKKSDKDKDTSQKKYYLHFSTNDLYNIGLINYIYRPYLISRGRSNKHLSDKLLVSTSFLFDHLLKFHNLGFSWRNLELTPEILAINKSPELREYVLRILEYFEKTHLRRIDNGVHQYKFKGALRQELHFLSKTNVAASAAFNFTLDESVLIKKHYKRKLLQLQKQNKWEHDTQHRYIHSESFINQLLGDLHYFDKEYEDAIIHYSHALDRLALKKPEEFSLFQFTNYVRTKLKIGLAYESINAFDSCYSLYASLIEETHDYIMQNSPIVYKTIGSKVNYYKKEWLPIEQQIKILIQPLLVTFSIIEKGDTPELTMQHLMENEAQLERILPANGDQQINRVSMLRANYFKDRGSILHYKNGNIRLTKDHHVCNYSELRGYDLHSFSHMWQSYYREKSLQQRKGYYRPPISALCDYYAALQEASKVIRNIGYVRNRSTGNGKSIDDYNTLDLIFHLLNTKIGAAGASFSGPETQYFRGVAEIIGKIGDCLLGFVPDTTETSWLDLIRTMKWDDNYIKLKLNNIPIWENYKNSTSNITEDVNTIHILALYRLSSKIYRLNGDNVNASLQLRKMMIFIGHLSLDFSAQLFYPLFPSLFPTILTFSVKILQNFLLKKTDEYLFGKTMKYIYHSHEHTVRPQVMKYEYMFGLNEHIYETKPKDTENLYNQVSSSVEAKESQLYFSHIILNTVGLNGFEEIWIRPEVDNLLQINKYYPYNNYGFSTCSNMYVRYLELFHKSKLNAMLLHKLYPPKKELSQEDIPETYLKALFEFETSEFDTGSSNHSCTSYCGASCVLYHNCKLSNNKVTTITAYTKLIADSIFCLTDAIRLLEIHGVNPVINYFKLAELHYHLGAWCHLLKKTKKDSAGNKDEAIHYKSVFKHLKVLMPKGFKHRLEPKQNFEKAKEYYTMSVHNHHEGSPYRRQFNNMFYLHDDFNENLSHFHNALERYHVNTGFVYKRIKHIEQLLKGSFMVKYTAYNNHGNIKDRDGNI